jgi:hypothetical protein
MHLDISCGPMRCSRWSTDSFRHRLRWLLLLHPSLDSAVLTCEIAWRNALVLELCAMK